MHWRGVCIAREGAHATICCSMLGLVRVRSAGCPARESVAACRGRSCRCGPAADRTPALQRGRTSLHEASSSGHAAVVQTLLQHGADVAARNEVGAAGLPQALAWRCARECLHAMFVRAIVCTQSCESVLLCRGSSVRRGRTRDGDGPHMHARPRHAPADTPARFRPAIDRSRLRRILR